MRIFILLAVCFATAHGQGCAAPGGIAGCAECNNPDLECIECLDGYWWKDEFTCLRCPDYCLRCTDSNADDVTECLECQPFYYKTADAQCEFCTGHCASCNGDFECGECGTGYRSDGAVAIECGECSLGCKACLDGASTSCTECDDGFYYVRTRVATLELQESGRCLPCGSRCLLCKSGTTCDLCDRGTTWTGTACASCITNCDPDFCETNGACKECIDNYFITPSFHQCRSCDHCTECPTVGPCPGCEDGYILIDDGTCQPCPDTENAITCPQCSTETRQRVFINPVCDYCPDNCASCTTTDACVICHPGFYRNDDNLCSPCDASCLTCDGAGSDNCQSCVTGQTQRGGECQDCPAATSSPNCATCGGQACSSCATGFYHVGTSSTDEAECRTCTNQEGIKSPEICDECASSTRGRFMSTERCRQCDDNGVECLTCTSNGDACLTCIDEYYVDSQGDCAQCIDSCKRCNDASTCVECNSGFYVADDNTCEPCIDDCASCSINSLATCEQCDDGFYEEYPSACTACEVDNCATCGDSIEVCVLCAQRYEVNDDGSECRDCPNNCLDCDSDLNCVTCDAGFALTADNACAACGVTNCVECFEGGELAMVGDMTHNDLHCHTCGTGMRVVFTQKCVADTGFTACSGADANCALCLMADASHCVKCNDGYYLAADGTCGQCTAGMDIAVCDPHLAAYGHVCDPGFLLGSLGACGMCDGMEYSTGCRACPTGMTAMAGGGCVACTATCDECDMSDNCAVCPTGYGYKPNNAMCTQCDTTGGHECAMCSTDGNHGGSGTLTCDECTTAGDTTVATDGTCAAPTMLDVCTAMNPGKEDNCNTCDAAGLCTACNTGYYLNTDECVACTDANCLTCLTAADTCTVCQYGYWLNADDGCSPCSEAITNCAICYGATANKCSKCMAGFYLMDDEHCEACSVVGCQDCPNDYCLDCGADMEVIWEETCMNDCPDHCTQCVSSTDCIACEEGYFFNSATLRCEDNSGGPCSANCMTCSAANTCSACAPGYMDAAGGCTTACIANCDVCVAANACMTCASGYRLTAASTCEQCHDPNCNVCTADAKLCGTCAPGYADETVCDACEANCKRCTKAATLGGAATCDECNDNFYVNPTTMQCTDCPSNCKVCPNGNCIECRDGFEMGDSGCTAESGGNLADCADDDGGVCVRCDRGFYLDPDTSTCESCASNNPDSAEYVCSGCANSGTILHDVHQSWVATCNDCVENCVRCTSATNCFECVANRYWDGTACQTLNCANLDGLTHVNACTMCSDTNYNKDDEHQGLAYVGGACIECPRNCISCTSATSCTTCTPSYSWSSAENACIPCNFDTADECIGCVYNNRGRYIDSNGLCRLCDEHCTRCSDSPSTCTACESSYFLSGTSCVSCTSADTQEGCVSCQLTYSAWANDVHAWMANVAVEGQEPTLGCLSCPQNCQVCSVINTCTTCFGNRYFFSDSEAGVYQCRDCITNCNVCENGEECIECASGYFYNEVAKTCDACPSNCATCTHKDGCTACHSRYYLTAEKTCGECSTAVSNCIACTLVGEAVTCSACSSEYYPAEQGSECANCIDNCLTCTDGTTCRTCKGGYCYDSTSGEPACRSNSGVNCDLCELRGEEEVSCLTCRTGYYLDICQACDDGECLACSEAANKCTACLVGYYLTQTDNPTCDACPAGCLECDRGDACTTCRPMSVWNADSNACIGCLTGCADCNDGETCNFCSVETAFVDRSNTPHACTNCVTGCQTCTTAEDCSVCLPGYRMELTPETMVFSACAPCSTGCLNCTLSEGETPIEICTDCAPGFVLQNDACLPCSSFSNCIDCVDTDDSGTIDTGECLECGGGTLLNDDESQCISCTITGCEYCIDRSFICTDCNGDQLPSPDEFTCGDPCWFCYDDEECGMGPELNGTDAVAGSPYYKVGCNNGCWATRIEHADGTFEQTKGCQENTEEYSCSEHSRETCRNYGEEDEAVMECSICCTDALCNTESPVGEDSGSTSVMASTVVVLVVALMSALTNIF